MDALGLAQSISETKRLLAEDLQNGRISKSDYDWEISHITGF